MSEINGPKFSVNQVNFQNTQRQNKEVPPESVEQQESRINDFGNPQAEALGRSMLIKDSDDVNHDLKALLDNPHIADNSDKMFETSFKAAQAAGVENPYEEAATFSTGAVK